MDWMLEATLTEVAAKETGQGSVAKLYEGTTMMTALADFESVLRVDMEVTESMIDKLVAEPVLTLVEAKTWFDEDGILFGCRDNKTRDRWEKNAYRSDLPNGACVICGKALGAHGTAAVHVVAGGSKVLAVADESAYQDDGGDMGMWGIGSECRKLIPAEFIHESSNV